MLQIPHTFLPLKEVLPIRRHHPFYRQPEQRYNTLDFAKGKIVCQGVTPFGNPCIPSAMVYTDRRFAAVTLASKMQKHQRNICFMCKYSSDVFIAETYERLLCIFKLDRSMLLFVVLHCAFNILFNFTIC